MAVVSRMWYLSKETCKFVHGAVKVFFDPNWQLPKTKLDPRMPAYPTQLHEWLRVFPWRHYWAYYPLTRTFCYSLAICWAVTSITQSTPLKVSKVHFLNHELHHLEANAFHAYTQRQEDLKYFKENDVMAKLRPKNFARELTMGDFKYFPWGFSTGGH
uniref:Uncharacterized protein n=1 Tax=Globodera rostochiensis TaxID=31243 RepID=A0A914I261_GLORO